MALKAALFSFNGIIIHDEAIRQTLTNQLLRKLFATPDAARMIVCTPSQAAQLPGHGLVWDEIPAVA